VGTGWAMMKSAHHENGKWFGKVPKPRPGMLKTARQHGVGNAWERNPLRGAASDSLRLYDNL